jgi:hypothetical protein
VLDERTEALLLDALSTASGGLPVAVDKGARVTAMHADGLTVLAGEPVDLAEMPVSGDLTAEDALLAVQVFDAFLNLAEAMQGLPGAIAMNDATRRKIKNVRAKHRAMISP